jgi:bifunctional DNA-binding transcriptional regulator/antitoxin component of YhaV-PrlF toxin-antitoxin module
MKLKTFNTLMSARNLRTAKVTVSKTGLISLNAAAAETVGLKPGDKLEIVQDEDSPKDWYIKAKSSEDGFEVRDYKNGAVAFNSVPLTQTIRQSLAKEGSLFIPVALEPVDLEGDKYFSLLTSAVK